MADATYVRDWDEYRQTADAAVSAREVWQLADGRAAVYAENATGASGDRADFWTADHYTMPKASGFVALSGNPAYWDHSANNVTYRKANDRDFLVGTFVGDWGSGDASCVVNLNNEPRYDIDLVRDAFLSVLAGTPAAGGFGYPVRLGGSLVFELTATAEAQKVDALSVDGFATGANAIVTGAFRVLSDGAGSAPDVSLGVANGTHATDADSITESLFVHLNGNDVNVYAESDDGTTEVAATDTTVDYTEGGAKAQQVEFWMDMRNPADVQVYVNGSLVLGSTVFDVDAAVGPWFLLAHVEKTSAADVYKIAVDWLRVRYQEQDSVS
jgi:hypothetical protein